MIITYNPYYKTLKIYRHGITLKKQDITTFSVSDMTLNTVGEWCRCEGTCKYDNWYVKHGIFIDSNDKGTDIENIVRYFVDDYTSCNKCAYDTRNNVSDEYIIFEGELNVCFSSNASIVFYKDLDYVPVRKTYRFKTLSKSTKAFMKKWCIYNYEMDNKFSRYYKNGYYTIDAWEFKKDTDFIVVRPNSRTISNFAPEIFRGHKEWFSTQFYLAYNSLFYNLEPFNTSRDYDELTPEEREAENKRLKDIEEENRKRLEQIEKQKLMDGYCDICGAANATYCANPYNLEMYGNVVMEWLCDYCYEQCAQDV